MCAGSLAEAQQEGGAAFTQALDGRIANPKGQSHPVDEIQFLAEGATHGIEKRGAELLAGVEHVACPQQAQRTGNRRSACRGEVGGTESG